MEASYRTREALLAHPAIRRFVAWIGGKPAGFKP
jgi:NADPH-dependent glutamate synthase beta subunit-like oxidoreductase